MVVFPETFDVGILFAVSNKVFFYNLKDQMIELIKEFEETEITNIKTYINDKIILVAVGLMNNKCCLFDFCFPDIERFIEIEDSIWGLAINEKYLFFSSNTHCIYAVDLSKFTAKPILFYQHDHNIPNLYLHSYGDIDTLASVCISGNLSIHNVSKFSKKTEISELMFLDLNENNMDLGYLWSSLFIDLSSGCLELDKNNFNDCKEDITMVELEFKRDSTRIIFREKTLFFHYELPDEISTELGMLQMINDIEEPKDYSELFLRIFPFAYPLTRESFRYINLFNSLKKSYIYEVDRNCFENSSSSPVSVESISRDHNPPLIEPPGQVSPIDFNLRSDSTPRISETYLMSPGTWTELANEPDDLNSIDELENDDDSDFLELHDSDFIPIDLTSEPDDISPGSDSIEHDSNDRVDTISEAFTRVKISLPRIKQYKTVDKHFQVIGCAYGLKLVGLDSKQIFDFQIFHSNYERYPRICSLYWIEELSLLVFLSMQTMSVNLVNILLIDDNLILKQPNLDSNIQVGNVENENDEQFVSFCQSLSFYTSSIEFNFKIKAMVGNKISPSAHLIHLIGMHGETANIFFNC
eukprot:TRINITY_DN1525_c0_g1_i1.p1 TRINITY_DN1525_c0_g1~~TRINITY_DN1525_c0_g1_i1.p1  ORF type:complete len:583 (+),score=139.75 TRINITY_DN1525_c0_g1_i1:171-1919(+)